ncbi:hypothetical protein [Alloactinosynnema sp. L-07]|uniref:hypothetical protein n=1 Tax=Alloactinosynnema sp. L-07 TaxID=1653480 RepID=UPI0012F81BB9|nr:hypothetical protein [Alloactinosynnema sp. L-07]
MANPLDPALPDLVAATIRELAVAHVDVPVSVIDAVVRQAAWELVATHRSTAEFARLLARRADARLLAMTGTLTPVRGRTLPSERAVADDSATAPHLG